MVGIKNIVLLAGAALPAWAAPLAEKRGAEVVPGKYIVTLKPGAQTTNHLSWVSGIHARSTTRRDTKGVNKVYNIDDFKGYSGSFDDATIAQIKASSDVSFAFLLPSVPCYWTASPNTLQIGC